MTSKAVDAYAALSPRDNPDTLPEQGVHITRYSAQVFETEDRLSQDRLQAPLPQASAGEVLWCHFVGITDSELLHRLLDPYHIHDLVLEDILSIKQRPKIEDYGDYLFMAARVFKYQGNKLQSDPVFMILGKDFVFSFQRRPLGIFTGVRGRIQSNIIDFRSQGADFLAYALIDRLVDDYFFGLEDYTARVDEVDKKLFNPDNEDILNRIHRLKRDGIRLRRTLVPMRESINQILRGDFPEFTRHVDVYLRDVYDHLIQLIESAESARDMVLSMMDVYLSYQSNRLNRQMRLLTVITLIFMPLTVITGIYGMNFDNMPELHWKYGYYMVLGLMVCIMAGMLTWFSRRKLL